MQDQTDAIMYYSQKNTLNSFIPDIILWNVKPRVRRLTIRETIEINPYYFLFDKLDKPHGQKIPEGTKIVDLVVNEH